ncbi:MAG: extracellular solute-binding protein, partial [Patescibacteria group bacterium]
MNLTRNQIIIIISVISIIVFFVVAFVFFGRKGGGGLGGGGEQQIELDFWGVEDESVIRKLTELYSGANPGVRIAYQQFDENNYEKSLLNALASNKGPDIFMLHNSWLPKHQNKITPAVEAQLPFVYFRDSFPKVVSQDFSQDNKIYALPLYIDTLAFIYNKDYFDAKAVALPPNTWESFQNSISRLKETDFSGRISKASAAIGGSEKSVDKAADLLSLIMLQYGADMTNENGQADFVRTGGLNAFNFYLRFSNPTSQYYTWNDNLRPSLDNFSNGTVAAIFNYSSAIPKIKAKNPFINIAVSPMLQFSGADQPLNYADYWGLTVSSQSKNSAWAWHFIQSAATQEQFNEEYLKISGRPPALRSLINKYLNDSDIGVFAKQALTAESWKQPDNNEIKKIFSSAIESVLSGKLSAQNALQEAENKINN